jgi:hypothetical protein
MFLEGFGTETTNIYPIFDATGSQIGDRVVVVFHETGSIVEKVLSDTKKYYATPIPAPVVAPPVELVVGVPPAATITAETVPILTPTPSVQTLPAGILSEIPDTIFGIKTLYLGLGLAAWILFRR